MRFAKVVAFGLVLLLMGPPAGAGGYERVEKITYVGSATPTPYGGFNCSASPSPGPGVGCVYVHRVPGESHVAASIDDAIAPDVSAWLVQARWDGTRNTDWVFHRFCTSTKRPIKLLPGTNRIYVVLWQATCPETTADPALATTGEVTITLTRSR